MHSNANTYIYIKTYVFMHLPDDFICKYARFWNEYVYRSQGTDVAMAILFGLSYRKAWTHDQTLTGVGDLKPGGGCQDALSGVCAGVESILVFLRRKHVGHCKYEAEKPGHKNRHDDLKRERRTKFWVCLFCIYIPPCIWHLIKSDYFEEQITR